MRINTQKRCIYLKIDESCQSRKFQIGSKMCRRLIESEFLDSQQTGRIQVNSWMKPRAGNPGLVPPTANGSWFSANSTWNTCLSKPVNHFLYFLFYPHFSTLHYEHFILFYFINIFYQLQNHFSVQGDIITKTTLRMSPYPVKFLKKSILTSYVFFLSQTGRSQQP